MRHDSGLAASFFVRVILVAFSLELESVIGPGVVIEGLM
jgi:hypothetical protein